MISLQQLRAPYAKLSAHQGFPDLLRAALLLVFDNKHVVFRHHILFDYAVSRLRLDTTDLQSLRRTLTKTEGLGFLLAPALGYALGDLWTSQHPTKQSFWDLVLELIADPTVDPIARVKISRVAADLPQSEVDIEPLIAAVRTGRNLRFPVAALSSALLAGADAATPPAPWDALIDALADAPQTYAESCRSLLYWAMKTPANLTSQRLASSARRLLSYTLTTNPVQRNLVLSAIDATARSFAADPAAARLVLSRVLQPKRMADHAHAEVPWLCQNIENIVLHDPEFAVEIYQSVFAHSVDTETPTRLGNSQILSLSSNARQDYSMAHWNLAEKYPRFIKTMPTRATEALIAAMHGYVARKHGTILSENAEEITVSAITVRLRSDGSYIWASNPDKDSHGDIDRMVAGSSLG